MDVAIAKLLDAINQYGFSVVVATVLLWFTLTTVNATLKKIVETQLALVKGQQEMNSYLRTLVAKIP